MKARTVNEYRGEFEISAKRMKLLHRTNNSEPSLSTNPERLIPYSISCNSPNGYAWVMGKNNFIIYIKPHTTFLLLDVKNNFWDFGNENDSPIMIGRKVYKYAIDNNVDIIKIKNIPQVGTEFAIINLDCIESAIKK